MSALDAAAFAAKEHIDAGDFDRHLAALNGAIRARLELLNPDRPPRKYLPAGQVWAWMHGPGSPHWEPRGTGLILSPRPEPAADPETPTCPGCGTEIPPRILCCDPCWSRIPTRVPGFDRPWRSARLHARQTRNWTTFEQATDAARAWLQANPARTEQETTK